MRLTTTLMAFGISCGMLVAQDAGNSADPFTITISVDQPRIKAGSEAWITVKMTNTSDHEVDCTAMLVNGVDRRFHYDVEDESGKPMRKQDLHPENYPGSVQMCTLEPGHSVSHQTRISWLDDLTKPGEYTVQLSRGAGETEEEGTVKSNKITITVTP